MRHVTELRQEGRSSQPDHLAGIEGLRAIAVLAVIAWHTNLLPFLRGGFAGVDVFLVISGYVMSRSLAGKYPAGFAGYLGEFYKKRILRVFPALIVCLLVTMIAATLFIPASWLSSSNSVTGLAAFWGGSNLALAGNGEGYFSPRVAFNPFVQTWSLAVGAQTYAVFSLIFYAWLKFGKDRSAARYLSRGLLPGLAILSLGYAYFETAANRDAAFYLLPGRFWEFAAGALLYQFHARGWCVAASKRLSAVFLASGLVLLGAAFVYADQNAFPFPWAIAPVGGAMLVISGVTNSAQGLSIGQRFLQSGPVAYVGRLSYSLYLWYWPALALFRWTVGVERADYQAVYLALVFLLAAVSYHFVETPFRRSTGLLKQQGWKVILAGLAAMVAAYFAAGAVDEAQASISLSRVSRDPADWRAYAYTPDGSSGASGDKEFAGRRLFVVGDSHTAAYRGMLAAASDRLRIEVHTYEQGGCPAAGLLRPMREAIHCTEFYDASLAEIARMARPGDIVFFASLRMPELSDQFEVLDETAVAAEFNGERAANDRRLALEEASQLIDPISASGVYVLIDAPLPVLKAPPYRCSDWFNQANPICSPGLSVDRGFLLKLRQPVMDSLTTLEGRHHNLSVWDPFFVLCEAEACSAFDGNRPLFFDGDHLSGYGNRALAPSFIDAIREIWGKDKTGGGK